MMPVSVDNVTAVHVCGGSRPRPVVCSSKASSGSGSVLFLLLCDQLHAGLNCSACVVVKVLCTL